MSVLGPPNYNLSHKAPKLLIYKGFLIRNGSFKTLAEILKSESKIFGMGAPPQNLSLLYKTNILNANDKKTL